MYSGGLGGCSIWRKFTGVKGTMSATKRSHTVQDRQLLHPPRKNKRALFVFMKRNQWCQALMLQIIDLVPCKLLYINSHCFSGGYGPGKLLLMRVNWASYAYIKVWISVLVFTFNSFFFDWRRRPSWWRFTILWERMSFRGIFANGKRYISYPAAYFML